jgi:hypothetical protein
MKGLILYPFYVVASLVVTILAYVLSPILPAFAKDGYLPGWLSWFQTPDNSLYGDNGWQRIHRINDYTSYAAQSAWIRRNPGQGFDMLLRAKIDLSAPVKVYGDLRVSDGWTPKGGVLLVTGSGYFHLTIIVPIGNEKCLLSSHGWRLRGIAEGYPSEMCKQFVFTPLRVGMFKGA